MITNIIALFFFLFPLFYLPVTADAYEYNKMILLYAAVPVFFLLFILKAIKTRRLSLTFGSFGTLLFFLTGMVVISTIFQSPNLAVSFTTPLSAGTFIAGFFTYVLLANLIDGKEREKLFDIFILDGVLISIYTILLYLGFFPRSQFTPAGIISATAIFLAVISIYILTKLIKEGINFAAGDTKEGFPNEASQGSSNNISPLIFGGLKRSLGNFRGRTRADNDSTIILYIIALLLIAGTAIFLTFHLATDQKPMVLPFYFGWPIFLEVAKNFKTLALGIGPANFITAFTIARPLAINQSSVANTIFTSSSSFALNIATENGIFAAFFYLLLLSASAKSLLASWLNHRDARLNFLVPLFAALLFQTIFPGSTTVFILTIVLFALINTAETPRTIDLSRPGRFIYLLILLPTAAIIVIGYLGGRAYLGEIFFKKSLDSLLNKDGTATYNYQKEAIRFNPYLDRYRVAFSQTNLALANALAGKDKLTDEDKQNIPRLIQQAIDQARSAVVLYKTNIVDWDNLARTYNSLANFVAESENWAIYSYRQKIILDPVSPQNHLALGQIYVNLKRFPDGENEFRQALQLKPDFAPALYNLGLVLIEEKKYREADQSFTQILSLIPKEGDDAKTVNTQLEKLKKLLPLEENSPTASPLAAPNRTQTLDPGLATSSAFQNLPAPLPTISLPPIPTISN